MEDRKALVIGVSGCSSSGKTTLARLLRDIFPNTFILHEDDFYKPENELPMRDGLLDWDCPEAVSVPAIQKSLKHIRSTGTFPPELASKEDQNTVGECPASESKIQAMRAKVTAWLQPGQPGHDIFRQGKLAVCLFDGFLLYCEEMESIMDLIDVKLFLLVSKAKATQRREARDGYVTLEGFWTDPPGYVEKIVWPNYAEAHAWLFEGGNVESALKPETLERAGIKAQSGKGLDVDFEETFEWAVDTIIAELEKRNGAST